MQQIKTWQFIHDNLLQQIPVMLLYVLQSQGSSPGRQGFFMGVNATGDMEGSIGGGMMEHKFVELAKTRLKEEGGETSANDENEIVKQVHDKKAGRQQSGMICSGEQSILIYSLSQVDIPAIQALLLSLKEMRDGSLELSPAGLKVETSVPAIDFYFHMQDEADWMYREKTGFKYRASIIGGGHCSLALSGLLNKLGFNVQVYEDRPQLKTFLQNNAAHGHHVVKDYTELKKLLEPAANHYVVIMTFGYRTDNIAIRALEGKNFAYLGVLGSSNKIIRLFEEYRREGISETWLRQLHAPIGLQIKSQTPEEIAVSIAAEIILVKNKLAP